MLLWQLNSENGHASLHSRCAALVDVFMVIKGTVAGAGVTTTKQTNTAIMMVTKSKTMIMVYSELRNNVIMGNHSCFAGECLAAAPRPSILSGLIFLPLSSFCVFYLGIVRHVRLVVGRSLESVGSEPLYRGCCVCCEARVHGCQILAWFRMVA